MKKLLVPFLIVAAILIFVQIGLALSGSVYRPSEKQLLVDGDMEKSGITSWTYLPYTTTTKETISPHSGNQVIRVAANTVAIQATAYQSILTAGKTYHVTGWARSDGTQIPGVSLGYTSIEWYGSASTAWQRIDFVKTATAAPFALVKMYATNGYVEFDDIMVTESAGYTLVQDTQGLVDGDMEASATSSWTSYQSATLTKQTSNPHSGKQVLRIAKNSPGGIRYAASQSIITTGKKYRINGWARGDGTNAPQIWVGGATTNWAGTAGTSWQRIDFISTADGTSLYLASSAAGDGYVEFDDVMATEYKGTVQNIEKQVLADGDMETSTTSSWLGITTILSKQTATPHGGKRLLRVAYNGGVQPAAYQYALTTGKKYRITGWGRSDGTNVPRVSVGYVSHDWIGTNSTSWQRFDFTFVANGAILGLYSSGVVAGYVEFDDVFITLAQ